MTIYCSCPIRVFFHGFGLKNVDLFVFLYPLRLVSCHSSDMLMGFQNHFITGVKLIQVHTT